MASSKRTGSSKTNNSRRTTSNRTTKASANKGSARTRSIEKSNTRNQRAARGRQNTRQVQSNPEFYYEALLVITIAIALLLFLSNFGLIGTFGNVINGITFGLFGITAYIIPFLLLFCLFIYLANKNSSVVTGKILLCILFSFIFSGLIQIFEYDKKYSFSDYYKLSRDNKAYGGFIGGIFAKLLCPFLGFIGSLIVLLAGLIILFVMITEKLVVTKTLKNSIALLTKAKEYRISARERYDQYDENDFFDDYDDYEVYGSNDYYEPSVNARQSARTFTFTIDKEQTIDTNAPEKTKATKSKRKTKEIPSNLTEYEPVSMTSTTDNYNSENYSTSTNDETANKPLSFLKPAKELEQYSANIGGPSSSINRATGEIFQNEMDEKFGYSKEEGSMVTIADSLFEDSKQDEANFEELVEKNVLSENYIEEGGLEFNYDDIVTTDSTAASNEATFALNYDESVGNDVTDYEHEASNKKASSNSEPRPSKVVSTQEAKPKKPERSRYIFPPMNLLAAPQNANGKNTANEINATADKLKRTLSSFGVNVTISEISVGPSVTRYELIPEQGIKVSKITNLSDDIKLSLAATDIRIEAPIPGKSAIGIEVPNKDSSPVLIKEIFEDSSFKHSKCSIRFAVGKSISGQCLVADIAKMPHLLIAGQTGSGKSVCINTIIMSILYSAHPDDVKLIMIDPKVVELSVYNGIPHLLTPVVTDAKKASGTLNWAVNEMVERYNKFATLGVRDIKGYNERVTSVENNDLVNFQKMPQIVIIVDELADLMMVAPGEVEDAICRLAQMARAAGMYLIIATQRPSVNVITGIIKANVPSRIAFSVASQIDSRTILDGAGAEKLLGKGDMLFNPSDIPKPVRIQGAFVSDTEVTNVVEFLKRQSESVYDEEIIKQIDNATKQTSNGSSTSADKDDVGGRDSYYTQAGKYIIEKDKASIGMLQRVFKIGFNRAARIMDQLASDGVVGPEEGTKPRKILMTMEEFEKFVEDYV